MLLVFANAFIAWAFDGFSSDKRVLGTYGGAGTGGRCVWGSLDLGSGIQT